MHTNRDSNYQKNISSAALFALAILILVISCPVKRLLLDNAVSQTSIPSSSHQTKNNQNSGVLFSSNTTCSAEKNTTAVLHEDKSQHKKIPGAVFTCNIFNHTGYYIHLNLDGITTEYNFTSYSDYSSLPLFLKHRSLLI